MLCPVISHSSQAPGQKCLNNTATCTSSSVVATGVRLGQRGSKYSRVWTVQEPYMAGLALRAESYFNLRGAHNWRTIMGDVLDVPGAPSAKEESSDITATTTSR